MIKKQISMVIVESQPIMRTALTTALTAAGLTILAEVADSRDALQTASRLHPDLILFSVNDFEPKDYGRISVLRQELPNSNIVALITGEFCGQFQSAMDHGAHLVLTKAAPRSKLLKALQWIVDSKMHPVTTPVN